MGTIEEAAALAAEAHAGQLDKIGAPYIEHPARVAASVTEHGPEAVIVAWLHDVVEDSSVTLAEIEAGFGPEVAAAVGALTKKKKEPLESYIARVAAEPLAVIVKQADVEDNSDPQRLGKLPPKKRAKLLEKYARTLELLAEATSA